MPVIKGAVTEEGALVKVSIGWSYSSVFNLRSAHRPIPAPVEVMALLDTGADVTCLDSAVIQQLGLPLGGQILVNTPAFQGMALTSKYDISVTILHPSGQSRDHLRVKNLIILELSLGVLGYQVLLGRDVLAECKFLYHGMSQGFLIRY